MTTTYRATLTALILTAIGLRMIAGAVWQSKLEGRFGLGDSETYWVLAKTIANGQPYEYGSDHARVFRTPGYPLLLAPILRWAGDTEPAVSLARLQSAILGGLAVLCVWWLARLLFDDRTALLAAALAACYPGAIALGGLVLSEAPFCPLMLATICLWTAAWQSQQRWKTICLALAAGLTAGAATLMRPSWLLFVPFALLIGLLSACLKGNHRLLKQHLVLGICMISGLVVVMLPWWIRNIHVTGQFVPTTLQVGASLYDGLNPNATGASNMDFVPVIVQQLRSQSEDLGHGKESFEVQLDRHLRDEALTWAWTNPGQTVSLAGVKFLRLWNVWPNEPRLSNWAIRAVVFLTYTPLLFFAIIGIWRTLGRGWPYILCWLPAVYFTMLHVVFVSSIRYREPAMLALLALAAGSMTGVRDWGLGVRGNDEG